MISEEHKEILDKGLELSQIFIEKIEEMADGDMNTLFLLFQSFFSGTTKYLVFEHAYSKDPFAELAVRNLRSKDEKLFEQLLAKKTEWRNK